MIGERYWSTGIMIEEHGRHGWAVWLDYLDDGFCEEASTEGRLRVRYLVSTEHLPNAIDTLRQDAERLGVRFGPTLDVPPTIYYECDGEGEEWPVPDDWRGIANGQARRLGWKECYSTEEVAT